MKINKTYIIGLMLLLISLGSYSQDKRTIETKVADILAQFPANDTKYTEKLMTDLTALGENGLSLVCNQILPSGSGDDTKARFAVESLSRFISQKGREEGKVSWEKICLRYATESRDYGVKDFFMKQLQLIGGEATINALKSFLGDKDLCDPSLAAIQAAGGKIAESALAEALRNMQLPCAASVMNALSLMKSQEAVNEYIQWSSDRDPKTRASALNALAQSGSPLASPVLMKAAKDALYRWEPSGAVSALLSYAENTGLRGDQKSADKLCRLILEKCNDKSSIQYKSEALRIFSLIHGTEAMKELIKAAGHPDKSYRNAAFLASLAIPGNEIVTKWLKFFPKALPEVRPEIISMLGNRRDEAALPLVASSLSDKDKSVRSEAAAALVKINGKKAVSRLAEYMRNFSDNSDQEAAKSALMTVSGNAEIDFLSSLLQESNPAARKSVIELMAWKKNSSYFSRVLPFTASDEDMVKTAAFKALKDLAGPGDQAKLIELMSSAEDKTRIADIQEALASAAGQMAENEDRSAEILKAMNFIKGKEKFIPVLARTGGREALQKVLHEFENGTPETRDICFKALTEWKDYTASSALYEICASGNKTFEEPAFAGCLSQIKNASLPDEQKLLLFRKIMPYAISAERKNALLDELGKLKTYQTLFFVAGFLDDPATSGSAANAAMSIALPSTDSGTGLYGTSVRSILTSAMGKLSGPESEYNREMINKYLASMAPDEGFRPMFNGKDLTGWQGLVENPLIRARMRRVDLERKQAEANVMIPANWSVKDGCIWFNGKGNNLCSIAQYGDFEMIADWKITKEGDSGIYLRGSPQVQIWDTSRTDVGAQVGSGGLYNNQVNPSKPLKVADNPVGEWNTFRILMIGEKVSVWLNGELVTDKITMENYWDRNIPIFPKGPIELQAHGTDLAFRDLYVREISDRDFNLTPEEKADGFVALFNGKNLDGWVGNKQSYVAENAMIVIKPENGSGGNLYTEKEYSNFIFRFEFQLTPSANNGIGIRAPLEGDAAYVGMEIQVLDNTAEVYAKLQPYQYHGSVYGVIPAKRDYLKPVGEWNYEEIIANGTRIKVTLNGTVIVDGDIAGPADKGTMDHNDHPGLKNKTGHIGFLGHGSVVNFRNIRIKELSQGK